MMSSTIEETTVSCVEAASIARLHGLACWSCGAVSRTLASSREVRQADAARIWTVSLCAGCHLAAAS